MSVIITMQNILFWNKKQNILLLKTILCWLLLNKLWYFTLAFYSHFATKNNQPLKLVLGTNNTQPISNWDWSNWKCLPLCCWSNWWDTLNQGNKTHFGLNLKLGQCRKIPKNTCLDHWSPFHRNSPALSKYVLEYSFKCYRPDHFIINKFFPCSVLGNAKPVFLRI